MVAAPSPGTTYRLASVPAVSRLNTQFTGPPLATLRKSVQVTSYTSYKTRCSAIVDFLVYAISWNGVIGKAMYYVYILSFYLYVVSVI